MARTFVTLTIPEQGLLDWKQFVVGVRGNVRRGSLDVFEHARGCSAIQVNILDFQWLNMDGGLMALGGTSASLMGALLLFDDTLPRGFVVFHQAKPSGDDLKKAVQYTRQYDHAKKFFSQYVPGQNNDARWAHVLGDR